MFRNVALIWDEEPFPFFLLCNENQTHHPTLSAVCACDKLLLLLVLLRQNSNVRGIPTVCVCDGQINVHLQRLYQGKVGTVLAFG